MPGLAGLISWWHPGVCSHASWKTMTGCMQHEKFHIPGSFGAPELGVFAGWVALEDSFAHSQPLMNEQADVILLVAGERFADPGVRTQLKARGHRLEESNAAWMVHLYEKGA